MKLTRASSYALHALAHLAGIDNGTPTPSHVIAQAQNIPERFLLKVLKPLVSTRVLVSIKGPHGGYKMTRPANEVTVLSVIESVEGRMLGDAPEFGEGGGSLYGALSSLVEDVNEEVRKKLGSVTIADLIAQSRQRQKKKAR